MPHDSPPIVARPLVSSSYTLAKTDPSAARAAEGVTLLFNVDGPTGWRARSPHEARRPVPSLFPRLCAQRPIPPEATLPNGKASQSTRRGWI